MTSPFLSHPYLPNTIHFKFRFFSIGQKVSFFFSKILFFGIFFKIFFHDIILASGEGNHFPSDESYQLNNWILAEINRVKAFPIEKLNLVPICRILRFLSKKNSLLNGLTSQWIDFLVCKSFESARWPLTVGDGLRRVFGVISSGKGFKKKFSLKYNFESLSEFEDFHFFENIVPWRCSSF